MTATRLLRFATTTLLVALASRAGWAQTPLPFAVGESLEYRVTVARLGEVGRARMWVDSMTEMRGHAAMLLRFDLRAGKGPIRASDRTASWLDTRRMASLRFDKVERHPLSRRQQTVDLYPETRRWVDARGVEGESASDLPLDELSFLYFLRTVHLGADSIWRFDRHYEAAMNPTTVRLVGRRWLATPAGDFNTLQLEMRVRDPRRYGEEEGVIKIDLSDDPRRLLVRMESTMPVLGRTVLLLERWVAGGTP